MRQLASPAWSAVAACACALGIACSSGSGGGATGTGPMDSGTTSDAASVDSGQQVDAGSCGQSCPGTPPAGSMCTLSADAQLLDTKGAPVSGEIVLLCGLNLCSSPVRSNAQGKVVFDLCLNMKSPALKYLGHATYVSFGAAMTQPVETFPAATLVALPSQGIALPSGAGSVTSGPVTLQLASGTVTFDPTQPNDPNSVQFRAAEMTPAQAPPGLDPTLGVKALWGLSPVNAKLGSPAALTVPNPDPTGWPAGTKVDFVLNGLDESPMPAVPYGGWGVIGTGTVSSDGKTITTDSGAGNGLPILGLVGVAPHK
jgi:hypothetical protein